MSRTALRLEGVWCSFVRGRERVRVLQGVSLEVPAGAIVVVLAEPGQGKTTLIRAASGTVKVDEGSIVVDGEELVGISEAGLSNVLAHKLAVARRHGPEARLTVEDYLASSLSATREGSRRSRRQTVARTLRDFDLVGAGKLWWRDLSDWQRACVELAAALIRRPLVLLVDDVLVQLGWTAKQDALALIEGFARDSGGAVLMAVSDHATLARGDHAYQLADGKLRLMHKDPDIRHIGHSGERAEQAG
jgi:ABC-type multidrug transport system ATPase subunit